MFTPQCSHLRSGSRGENAQLFLLSAFHLQTLRLDGESTGREGGEEGGEDRAWSLTASVLKSALELSRGREQVVLHRVLQTIWFPGYQKDVVQGQAAASSGRL